MCRSPARLSALLPDDGVDRLSLLPDVLSAGSSPASPSRTPHALPRSPPAGARFGAPPRSSLSTPNTFPSACPTPIPAPRARMPTPSPHLQLHGPVPGPARELVPGPRRQGHPGAHPRQSPVPTRSWLQVHVPAPLWPPRPVQLRPASRTGTSRRRARLLHGRRSGTKRRKKKEQREKRERMREA
ncbi:hypothetical protein DAI22_07g044100 [Oryza sativa Japonica Group]|nr:hypothetical protein DAI22_07g044100 [Oryza sativa Japonica Group]